MRQITVVAKNTKDLITDITGLLGGHDIDIRNMNSLQVEQNAYVKLVVDSYDRSLKLLTEAGYNAVSDESVLLRIQDKAGALAQVARTISGHGIHTRAITMLQQDGEFTVIAVGTDDNDQVRELFRDTLVS
ncbi:MAG: hypothetical protein QGI68_05640 [Pseudomonadales bacterium]|jgi:hypothetical protein|nr:hypothetical protein [Pseudomonadales bacterium]MDP7357614.1 hypothetical protein [Pseudomonadales bacterium]MDP7595037.1 hypothetical protein [Pseudomonadales bacterium]HJN51406.1 hypothetical protein [Pseudomonadales bacterium]|tara:strand:+ start:483 stop:875 length:393 start_codon:yes stop_codon:yes gene_type:complete